MGLSSDTNLLFRQGHVVSRNFTRRVPAWVAYRVTKGFRKTPHRKGQYNTSWQDSDITNALVDSDYTGRFSSKGYARGHLSPYGVFGNCGS